MLFSIDQVILIAFTIFTVRHTIVHARIILSLRGMKLPKIENDDHILISSSKGNRISYKSDEKMRFQVNVNRLLNVKSYLNDVMENQKSTGDGDLHKNSLPNVMSQRIPNQRDNHHHHQSFNTRHPTKLPPIKK